VTYPTTAPEIALPELDGKTAKMYRGGKICLTDHFKPLWARNVPKFGIAHAMALGVSFSFYILLINLSELKTELSMREHYSIVTTYCSACMHMTYCEHLANLYVKCAYLTQP
jgi:hypothetical protein